MPDLVITNMKNLSVNVIGTDKIKDHEIIKISYN